jgi:hypothetical protein
VEPKKKRFMKSSKIPHYAYCFLCRNLGQPRYGGPAVQAFKCKSCDTEWESHDLNGISEAAASGLKFIYHFEEFVDFASPEAPSAPA